MEDFLKVDGSRWKLPWKFIEIVEDCMVVMEASVELDGN